MSCRFPTIHPQKSDAGSPPPFKHLDSKSWPDAHGKRSLPARTIRVLYGDHWDPISQNTFSFQDAFKARMNFPQPVPAMPMLIVSEFTAGLIVAPSQRHQSWSFRQPA
jgi:hypothetical protein